MATVPYPSFQWRTMTDSITQLPKAPTVLQDLVFKTRNTRASDIVEIDIEVGGTTIAPIVSPHSPGVVVQKLTGDVRAVKTPTIRMLKEFNAHELLGTRAPGQNFYVNGAQGIEQARSYKVGIELADLKIKTDRAIEYMCAQSLKGAYTASHEDYTFEIDFQMPATHKPVLGAGLGWNEGVKGEVILDDMDGWAQLISDATGYGPSIALCGKNTVTALRGNAEIRDMLKASANIKVGNQVWDANNTWIGELNGINLYRYGNTYTDPVTKAKTKYIDDDAFILIAPEARFSIEFGPIKDLSATSDSIISEYFSKSWLEETPSGLWILAESHPLPVPWQPEAVVYADVIV